MTAPICPVDGRACAAACAGKPSCERAGAVVGRVRSAAVRKQAEDAVIEAARDCVTIWRVRGMRDPELCLTYFRDLEGAVDALTALEAQE